MRVRCDRRCKQVRVRPRRTGKQGRMRGRCTGKGRSSSHGSDGNAAAVQCHTAVHGASHASRCLCHACLCNDLQLGDAGMVRMACSSVADRGMRQARAHLVACVQCQTTCCPAGGVLPRAAAPQPLSRRPCGCQGAGGGSSAAAQASKQQFAGRQVFKGPATAVKPDYPAATPILQRDLKCPSGSSGMRRRGVRAFLACLTSLHCLPMRPWSSLLPKALLSC